MTHHYHFTAEERAAIMLMQTSHSIRAMAHHIGRAPSPNISPGMKNAAENRL
ncbi:hypothetical protein [Halomonas sp.]|jgi:IS30 family transposase|uniref:hypothetical protein n=1 Tax=Halomonas sp. TaxID=1486246 RepID=UPI00356576DC